MSDLATRIAAKAKELNKQKRTSPVSSIAPIQSASPKSNDAPRPELKNKPAASLPAKVDQPKEETKSTYREGKRNISAYHPESVFRQFKILAAENDKTVQELHREALNLLFKFYDKPPIA